MQLETIVALATQAMKSVLAFVRADADFSTITRHKGRDVTRRFDLIAEQTLQDELLMRGIDARIVSEECGDRVVGNDPSGTFVFDPIDGSTNAAIGFPYFCSSLGYAPKIEDVSLSDIVMGAVVTNSLGVYTVMTGEMPHLDGAPLVKRKAPRHKPIVASYTYGVPHVPKGVLEFEKQSIVRVFGSIALDLCQVATGTLDAVIDTRGRLSSYDIAVAQLIVDQSGGIITKGDGSRLDAPIAASNISLVCSSDKTLHHRILEMLKQFPQGE